MGYAQNRRCTGSGHSGGGRRKDAWCYGYQVVVRKTVCGKSQKRACPRWVKEKQRHLLIMEGGGLSERTMEDITGPKAELLSSDWLTFEWV